VNEPLAYHRLARTAAYEWWRPLAELALFVVFVFAIWLVVVPGLKAVLGPDRDGASGLIRFGLLNAVMIPPAMLAARIMRRSAGGLSSVEGRLRWRWLGTCTLVALAFSAVCVTIYAAVDVLGLHLGGPEYGGWVGWAEFLPLALAVLCVVPLQATAEEYVFRGTLLQAVGAWTRHPWIAIVVTSLVFGAAHGPGLASLLANSGFGAVAAYVTIRTGGLEAAIAFHVASNVTVLLLDAATGRSRSWFSQLDVTWAAAVFDLSTNALFGLIIVWISRRPSAAARAPAGP
jgi:membrane protease YdiL (CAAX protease family)